MSRIFTGRNTPTPATVHDVEARQVLRHVLSVDIDKGVVRVASQPLRFVGDEIDATEIRFRSIYPIYGGGAFPALFHCYGRLA